MKYFEQLHPIPYGQNIVLIYEVTEDNIVVRIARHNLATNKSGILNCPFKMKMSWQRPMTETTSEKFEKIGNGLS